MGCVLGVEGFGLFGMGVEGCCKSDEWGKSFVGLWPREGNMFG